MKKHEKLKTSWNAPVQTLWERHGTVLEKAWQHKLAEYSRPKAPRLAKQKMTNSIKDQGLGALVAQLKDML